MSFKPGDRVRNTRTGAIGTVLPDKGWVRVKFDEAAYDDDYRPDALEMYVEPKPYYVNAPGAEPKSGDVFISGSFVVAVRDNEYAYTHNNDTYVLRGPHRGASHGVGSDFHKRTLVVRDGKPWVA